jgi:hypothetical protein
MNSKTTRPAGQQDAKWRSRTVWIAAVLVIAAGLVVVGSRSETGDVAAAPSAEFAALRAQTVQLIEYNSSIALTPDQEAIKKQALTRIPAPCCSDKTAYTCCCPCNMAKSWWGLASHLIADEGYGADEVQAAVEDWIATIHPDGFRGNACYVGGCSRPFREDGCGGMKEKDLVF